MNQDQILSILRSVLKIGGGALVAHGITDDATAQAIMGGVLAVVGLVWAHFTHKTTP